MKDIADKANVSVATVSYILNNVKNQKISKETRERVLKICSEMGYLPNLTARALATKKSGMIGILNVRNSAAVNPWQDYIYSRFINQTESILLKNGYHTLYTNIDIRNPELNVILQRELDGVLLLNISEDIFYKISNKFKVPVVIIDGFLDDQLFHKILPDYDNAIKKAKDLLVRKPEFIITSSSNNRGVYDKIKNLADENDCELCFASTEADIAEFSSKHTGQKGIIINEFIALFAARYLNTDDFVVLCTSDSPDILKENIRKIKFIEEKSKVASDIILKYLNGNTSDFISKYTLI